MSAAGGAKRITTPGYRSASTTQPWHGWQGSQSLCARAGTASYRPMGTRSRNKMHSDMIQRYMRSKRNWTVEAMPTMSAHEWRQLEAWWAGFRFERRTYIRRRDAATASKRRVDPAPAEADPATHTARF